MEVIKILDIPQALTNVVDEVAKTADTFPKDLENSKAGQQVRGTPLLNA